MYSSGHHELWPPSVRPQALIPTGRCVPLLFQQHIATSIQYGGGNGSLGYKARSPDWEEMRGRLKDWKRHLPEASSNRHISLVWPSTYIYLLSEAYIPPRKSVAMEKAANAEAGFREWMKRLGHQQPRGTIKDLKKKKRVDFSSSFSSVQKAAGQRALVPSSQSPQQPCQIHNCSPPSSRDEKANHTQRVFKDARVSR